MSIDVRLAFTVETLDEISQNFVSETLTRKLQLENDRLRGRVAELEQLLATPPEQEGEPEVGQLDKAGTAYDPKVHTGTRTAKGLWRNKRGLGETAAAVAELAGATPTQAAAVAAVAPVVEAAIKAAAPTIVDMRTSLRKVLEKFGGDVAKAILLQNKAESIGAAKPESYAAIIADCEAKLAATDGDPLEGI